MSENSTNTAKRKNTLLPVLTVLFLVAYSMMTMLIVEQDNTIHTQSLLIKELFSDSSQLSAMKGREVQKRNAEKAHPKPYARKESPRPRQSEPRVDTPQAPADLQRSVISL
ncbi:MAG TPA: hypothetical protein VJN48_08245 [Terriglobales bacterium]|nr:hypothetical protein [Terriglobales bacterium]